MENDPTQFETDNITFTQTADPASIETNTQDQQTADEAVKRDQGSIDSLSKMVFGTGCFSALLAISLFFIFNQMTPLEAIGSPAMGLAVALGGPGVFAFIVTIILSVVMVIIGIAKKIKNRRPYILVAFGILLSFAAPCCMAYIFWTRDIVMPNERDDHLRQEPFAFSSIWEIDLDLNKTGCGGSADFYESEYTGDIGRRIFCDIRDDYGASGQFPSETDIGSIMKKIYNKAIRTGKYKIRINSQEPPNKTDFNIVYDMKCHSPEDYITHGSVYISTLVPQEGYLSILTPLHDDGIHIGRYCITSADRIIR